MTPATEMNFKSWIVDQKDRQDPVGGLARALEEIDYSYIQPRRKPDEHKKWADIITRHAELKHVRAFNRAWQEYQEAAQEEAPPSE